MKRLRRPLSLLLCLAFLWTQVAVSALACDPAQARATVPSDPTPCHGQAATPPADPRCQPHCHPQPPLPDTSKLPVFAPLGGSPHAGVLVLHLDVGGHHAQPTIATTPHASPPLIDLYAHRLI